MSVNKRVRQANTLLNKYSAKCLADMVLRYFDVNIYALMCINYGPSQSLKMGH